MSKVLLRLCVLVAAFAACLANAARSPAFLTYRFTARSFLPAACHQSYADLNKVWKYTTIPHGVDKNYSLFTNNVTNGYVGPDSKVGFTRTINTISYNTALMCPIWQDIENGKYDGHPDFEADTAMYADGCSGRTFNLTDKRFGGRQCNNTAGNLRSLSPIVDTDMVRHTDGLPKPIYCTKKFFANDPRCGWLTLQTAKGPVYSVTTSGPDQFLTWYRDSPKYNLRSGFTLNLLKPDPNKDIFSFAADPFFPLQRAGVPCVQLDRKLDCSNGGTSFPLAQKDRYKEGVGADKSQFTFTTEHHSFFQLRGDETFEFSGDDDVWVYINERLAVDVGGIHSPANSIIDLSSAAVRESLGIEINKTYPFDIFHAERHTEGSSFRMTTTLTGGCTVEQSGKPAYYYNPETLTTDWKLIGGPTWGLVDNAQIILTDKRVQGSVGYAFLKQQMNVGAGFIATFSFTASQRGEGFVFVIQRDDIVDLNGGSGGNLGFRNSQNSIGIVFDFCADRNAGDLANPACDTRELRMHYVDPAVDGPGPNHAQLQTRKLFAPLYLPVIPNDGRAHTVVINYFGTTPDWLEVIMDNDLILQKRGIDIESIIGGRNAFVGFTAATGQANNSLSEISITNMSINTVQIEDKKTIAIGIPLENENLTTIADGKRSVSVDLKNRDFCDGDIQFGGLSKRAKGILTLVEEDPGVVVSRRQLARDAATPSNLGLVVDATIVDLDNGFYTLKFSTTVPGTYSMQVWYGESCFVGGNNTGEPLENPPVDTCFTQYRNKSVVFIPVKVEEAPTVSEVPESLPQVVITGIAVAGGFIVLVGSVIVFFGVRVRNRWRRDKAFVDAGKHAIAEREIEYTGDQDLDILQKRLQLTLDGLQSERAKKWKKEGDNQSVIDELNRQRGELQEQVRRLKIRQLGGDPNAPEEYVGIGTKIRKSFAPRRVSRNSSMRISAGFALSQAKDAITGGGNSGFSQMSSSRPLFGRLSQAYARKGPPPGIPVPVNAMPASNLVEAENAQMTSGNPLFATLSATDPRSGKPNPLTIEV